MIYDVSHRTTYVYRKPVLQSQHLVHLTPRASTRQDVLRHSLLIEPAPASSVELADYFGNGSVILTIDEEHSELVIHARSTVSIHPPHLPMPGLSAPWEHVAERAVRSDGQLEIDVLQFVSASRHTRVVAEALDYARPSFPPGRPILEAALDLTKRIYRDFKFDSSATDISTPVSHVLKERRGVCQDFAHLAITCLRGLGLPARYVSGYLLTYPPPGMEKLQGADASHAWVSVWAPGRVGSTSTPPTA
jgi:transglutaminase-like putative cysteine protease